MLELLLSISALAHGELGPGTIQQDLTPRDLVEVVEIENVEVSPDGKWIAVATHRSLVEENTLDLAVWITPINGGSPAMRLTTAGAPIWMPVGLEQPITPRWSPDGNWIYFRALENGEVQVWRVNRAGHKEQVTHETGDVLDFNFDTHGRLLFRTDTPREQIIAAEKREDRIGVHMDGSVEVQMDVAHNDDYAGRRVTLRRDPLFRFLGPPQSGLVKALAQDGSAASVSREDQSTYTTLAERERFGLFLAPEKLDVRFKRSSNDSAWVQRDREQPPPPRTKMEKYQKAMERGPDTFRIVAQLGAQTPIRLCREPVCSGTKLRLLGWERTSQEVIFLRQEADGSTGIYAWLPTKGSVRKVFASDGLLGIGTVLYRSNSAGCPLVGDEAICTIASAASPPRLIAIDLLNGGTRQLFDPNAALRRKHFGKATVVHWTDSHGIDESGVLVLPSNFNHDRRIPLVVTSYRCDGFLRGGFGMDVPEHLLAQSGIAALCANYAGNRLPREDDQPVILSGLVQDFDSWRVEVSALVKAGIVDACRVGVSGTSHGSASASYSIWNSSLYSAAALSNPWELDPSTFYFFGAPGNEFIVDDSPVRTFYGLPDPENDPLSEWKKVSPALNVNKTHAAVLMQVPDTEFRLGMEYLTRMTLAHRPIDMFVFYHESHVKRQPAHRDVVYQRNVDWFRFWFQGIEDGRSPLKDEYAYWRKLKANARADPMRQAAFEEKSRRAECNPGWF